MNPVMESLARRFKVCKVNIDTNPALAAKFRVEAVPTFLIFRQGQVVRRHEGAVAEAILAADLEAAS
jgi:thioredoxin 1